MNVPVEVGRRDPQQNEPASISVHPLLDNAKLVIAEANVQGIPRRWFRIGLDNGGRIAVENLHPQMPVPIYDGVAVSIGEKRSFENEVLIVLDQQMAIRVQQLQISESSTDEYRTLATFPSIPGDGLPKVGTSSICQSDEPGAIEIGNMLRLALQVVQKAAGSNAFFQAAAAAAAQIVNLDRAIVLLRNDTKGMFEIESSKIAPDGWSVAAYYVQEDIQRRSFGAISRTILQRVEKSLATVIHDPGSKNTSLASKNIEYLNSLMDVHCTTASPILNRDRELIGVLYGDRWSTDQILAKHRISDLEATLVEIIASSVAGGIARQTEERMRSALTGFFSPKVVELLSSNPKLMEGHDSEITVLFCDIRGFSSVTEKLGPQKSIEWMNDVLSELSQCVIDRDGVLVDYVGDELLAMWGAPVAQPDHAQRALDTARAMMDKIEILRARWSAILPQRFGAGIGVNTGPARVGNVGSKQKFKYGALGNTVNVGSRLQSATKQLGVDCVASEATVIAAQQQSDCRRLTKLSVVGIEQAIDVYEVMNNPTDSSRTLSRSYELALADFEAQNFGEAARRIGELFRTHRDDRPCKKLLVRAVKELDEPSENFSPIWNLTQK